MRLAISVHQQANPRKASGTFLDKMREVSRLPDAVADSGIN